MRLASQVTVRSKQTRSLGDIMEYEQAPPRPSISKRVIAYVAGALLAGGALVGYAFHEHRVAADLAAQNQQTGAALEATRNQVSDLTAKVNSLAAAQAQAQAAAQESAFTDHRTATQARHSDYTRWRKMQAQ